MNHPASDATHYHRRAPLSRLNSRFRNNNLEVRIATAAAVASRRQTIRSAHQRKLDKTDPVPRQQVTVFPATDSGSGEVADTSASTDSHTVESTTVVPSVNLDDSNDQDHNTGDESRTASPLPLEDTNTNINNNNINNNVSSALNENGDRITEPVARTRTDEALERLITGLEGFLSLSTRLNRLEAAQNTDRQIEQPPPYQLPHRSVPDDIVESGPSNEGHHFPILDVRFPWVQPKSKLDRAQDGDSKPLDLIDLVHPALQNLVNETQYGNIRPSGASASGSVSRYIAEKEKFINFFCHPSIFVAAWSAWGECMVRGSFCPVWRIDMLDAVNWHLSYILAKSQKYQWTAVMAITM